ncbi:hypothetical protein [Sporisorium scitamineum]|uniref:4a-hydroxytetrahydrobiopterin dehydratase n=1 Tax=Sporisorium scitamineum TaxID=49012 RepID=A0A0F7SAS1_9BASI|nr:hypothetical protein [Sporisorium scitamineum]
MSQDEATQMLSSLKGKWSLSPQPKTLLSSKATHPDALHRTYKFKDLTSAQAFANQLGALAETEGHHPAIMVEWGRLHKNDFVMAAKTEELVHQAEGYTPPKPKA